MGNSEKHRILLVDDDEGSREALSEWIERQGWEPLAVGNGDESLEHIHDGISVIVTDLKMPRTDGMELLRRAKEKAPHAAVIMVSGYGTVETAVEALKQGAFDFLSKPINAKELKQRLERAIEKRSMAAEIADLHRQQRLGNERFHAIKSNAMVSADLYLSKVEIEDGRSLEGTLALARILGAPGTLSLLRRFGWGTGVTVRPKRIAKSIRADGEFGGSRVLTKGLQGNR